jgi:hypothetical protein
VAGAATIAHTTPAHLVRSKSLRILQVTLYACGHSWTYALNLVEGVFSDVQPANVSLRRWTHTGRWLMLLVKLINVCQVVGVPLS